MSNLVGEPDGATPLDPDEMEGLLFKHVQTRGQLDELEQANIQSGLKWLKRQKNSDVLTENFVCTLHKKLFGDVWGLCFYAIGEAGVLYYGIYIIVSGLYGKATKLLLRNSLRRLTV